MDQGSDCVGKRDVSGLTCCTAPGTGRAASIDVRPGGKGVTERGAGLSLPPDAPVEAIRVACTRLLDDSSFREAAKRLGDRVALEAENSTVVEELEAAASGRCSTAA